MSTSVISSSSSSYIFSTPGISSWSSVVTHRMSSWSGVATPGIYIWLFYSFTPVRYPETIFIFVVGGVAIWDRITQVVKKIKIRILVVSVGERIHAVDNVCRDGERVKGTPFDTVSGKEVEEPIGTLEVSCWSEADIGFCAGLHGVACKVFLVCRGICAEFNFAVFLEVNGGPRHECSRRNCAGNAAIYGERIDPENGVFHHAGDNYVW